MGRQFDEVTRRVEDSFEQTNQQAAETTERVGQRTNKAARRIGDGVEDATQNAGTGIRSARSDLSLSGIEVDVADREDELVVMADLPGFDREEIDATLSGDTLRIVADHEESTESTDETYLRRERRRNSARRSVTLPAGTIGDEATAEYENGVLVVTVPKDGDDGNGRSLEIN